MTPDYSKIPPSTLETLQAWIRSARPMGSFCEAVVSNDLKEAFARADDGNIKAMFHTVSWLYNRAPIGAWGNPRCLRDWPKTVAAHVAGGVS